MVLWLGVGVGLGALLAALFFSIAASAGDEEAGAGGSFFLIAALICLGLLIVWNDGDRSGCVPKIDSGIYYAQVVGEQNGMTRLLVAKDHPESGNSEYKCLIVSTRVFSEKPVFSTDHKVIIVTKNDGFTRIKVLQGE